MSAWLPYLFMMFSALVGLSASIRIFHDRRQRRADHWVTVRRSPARLRTDALRGAQHAIEYGLSHRVWLDLAGFWDRNLDVYVEQSPAGPLSTPSNGPNKVSVKRRLPRL